MSARATHGLTLLEVVLAIGLLCAMTVALLPILVDATKATAPEPTTIDRSDLRAYSDEFLKDEKRVAEVREHGELRGSFGQGLAEHEVTIRRIAATDRHCPHDWFEFLSGGSCVVRYVARPEPKPDAIVASGEVR